jgi:hypothetical protein
VCVYFSQAQKFRSRSGPEKCWALFHPFAAVKVKKIYNKAMPFYYEVQKKNRLDTFSNGGKLDAFRHAYFMAAFSQKIKVKKARKLGVAHEKGNYKDFKKGIKEDGEIPDSLSTVMDLHNNEVGLKIGKENKNMDLKALSEIVLASLQKGEGIYFKRNSKGRYLTCHDEIIDREMYTGKWVVPKCLIKINE